MNITLEDISSVSKLMDKDFSDNERIIVLQHLTSCDVQACPGSGKTTAMVAKIVILAQKLIGTNSGICALSHTNAARDEIGKSLGSFASMLFKYPNFVSTIQVFTDTFLAIPAYIEECGKRPVVIDDETYEIRAKKYYSHLPRRTQSFLEIRTGGGRAVNFGGNTGAEYFANISYSFEDKKLVYFDGQDEKPFYSGETTQSYLDVQAVKNALTEEGYLTYHDAFYFANWYLKKYPKHSAALSRRFPYVFIDEMQDTDKYQLQLIETIFSGKSVLQKFGDSNQAIYGHKSENFGHVWNPQTPISINSSRRLSTSISHLSENLGLTLYSIDGNNKHPNHSHTIILYDNHNIDRVIPVFGNIIQNEGLIEGPFVALGAVGKLNADPNRTSIASYWPSFVNNRKIGRISISFWDSILLARSLMNENKNFIKARELLLHGVSVVLREQGNVAPSSTRFNAQVLHREATKANVDGLMKLNTILLGWCQSLYTGNQLTATRVISDLEKLFELLSLNLAQDTKANLEREYATYSGNVEVDSAQPVFPNRYHHADNIDIAIDTIHSAKGRTHQATLLLETFYHQFDLESLVPYLHGDRLARPGTRIANRYLPLAYVACTRPKHLLCLAIQRGHINDEKRHLLMNYGWAIQDLSE